MIETVSSHFGYIEEYVLDHSFPWLYRKYEQANREQYDKSSLSIIEGFKSLLLFMDSALNKGKQYDKILPPSYEEAVKNQGKKQEQESKFVIGKWWQVSA